MIDMVDFWELSGQGKLISMLSSCKRAWHGPTDSKDRLVIQNMEK